MANLVIAGRRVVVIGGGPIAARKVADLLKAKAAVTVVAPEACEELKALAGEGRIALRTRAYQQHDLDGAFVAIASTDDEDLNAQIARDANLRGVLINVVDRPALCTFFVPATVIRGDLTLAVATDGRSPALAGILREELESRYGPEYAKLVDLFAALRSEMMARGWDGSRIRETLSRLYRGGVMTLITAADLKARDEFLRYHLGPEFPLPQSGW